MVCKKCGAPNTENAAFCRKCGAKNVTGQSVSVKSVGTELRAPTNVQHRGARKRPVLTTRKTNKRYLIPNLISDILFDVGLAVFLYMRGSKLYESYWYRSEGEVLQRIAAAFFLLGLLSALYHTMISRTYADVFMDRIVGSGMQGIQTKSFILRFNQISGISTSKGILNIETGACVFLVINTSSGNYKVITTEERANSIIEHYLNVINR